MVSVQLIGIDPGLVHTGCVSIVLVPHLDAFQLRSHVVAGLDVQQTKHWVEATQALMHGVQSEVFIEAYRPRSHFDSDAAMGAAVKEMKQALPGSQTLLNTGVKKIVTPELMKAMNIWSFSQRTNHQDLRSAARIAVYGGLKDPEINPVITKLVLDHLDGNTWKEI